MTKEQKEEVAGVREVAVPVTFSVLTNIVAFLPLYFVPGTMGKVMMVIPVVVISVFIISLVESLFVLPAHLGHLSSKRRDYGFMAWLHRRQQRFSLWFKHMVETWYGPLRYFDGFSAALPMKCYRCPLCGCVITVRPAEYFPRIRSCMQVIVTCLTQRLEQGRWPALALRRSRLRHWLANLAGQVRIYLTETWSGGLLRGYEELRARGLIPIAWVS